MSELVTVEQRDALLLIGVNRPKKRNAWNIEIIQTVAQAYTQLANDPTLRVGVVYGHGDHFTAGLDLANIAPALTSGSITDVLKPEWCDPWDFFNEPCPKPIVVALQGRAYTLAIELALASQVVIAAEDTQFAQLEVARGIAPFGGGTYRLGARLGARGLQWLFTGEIFGAAAALDAGLVSEVVPVGTQLDRAIEVATTIANNAPLAVQAALKSHRAAERAARDAAAQVIREESPALFTSGDAMEGMMAMMQRRAPDFKGT